MTASRIPETDLLGRPLTPLEREVAAVHAALIELCRRPDLPPCIAANAATALATTWQMMNDLDLGPDHPEDVGS